MTSGLAVRFPGYFRFGDEALPNICSGQIQSSAIYTVRNWEWTIWIKFFSSWSSVLLLTRGQAFALMLKLRGMFFKSPAWGTWMITLCTMISLHMGWNHMWTAYTRKCVYICTIAYNVHHIFVCKEASVWYMQRSVRIWICSACAIEWTSESMNVYS